MHSRNIKIIGIGKYLPNKIVTAEDIDKKLGLDEGWTFKKSGVAIRHFVDKETSSQMGALAIKEALKDANMTMKDIDLILCTSGTAQQEIPCTASLIQEQLGEQDSGIPAFDVNSTCLSFVTGLDTISYLVEAGRYKRVVLVATEVASVGIDWSHKESATLFGDGAVAVIIEKTPANETSKIITSRMETYSKGAHLSEIRGGGSAIHPRQYSKETEKDFLFEMDGTAIFKMASKIAPSFLDRLFKETPYTLSDMKLFIPHQASAMAMRLLQKKLGVSDESFVSIIHNHGNVIAASIPMCIYEVVKDGRLKRGDKVAILGTSAGLSLGGMVFEY
jgi:3-oxoacyl-[acyl-carrier-protein] synthase-3